MSVSSKSLATGFAGRLGSPLTRRSVTLGLIGAGLSATGAGAQLFRPLERIPEPTIADVDPGQTRGSANTLPYEFRRQPVYLPLPGDARHAHRRYRPSASST